MSLASDVVSMKSFDGESRIVSTSRSSSRRTSTVRGDEPYGRSKHVLTSPINHVGERDDSDQTAADRASMSGCVTDAEDKRILRFHLAFTACWSPYFLLTMMNSLDLIQSHLLIRVTSSLCYMNSLANPLIYWLFATNFCLQCR